MFLHAMLILGYFFWSACSWLVLVWCWSAGGSYLVIHYSHIIFMFCVVCCIYVALLP